MPISSTGGVQAKLVGTTHFESMWSRVAIFWLASLNMAAHALHGRPANATTGARFLLDGQEMVRVVVGFRQDGSDELLPFLGLGRPLVSDFERTQAVTMTIPASQLDEIKSLPSVDYVDEDDLSYMSSESIPWGISRVQGSSSDLPSPLDSLSPADSSGCSVSVCIIDSGMLLSHEDIVSPLELEQSCVIGGTSHHCARQPFTLDSSRIRGTEFSLNSGEVWYDPKYWHGTHVSGIILAQGGNNVGVVGMVPDPSNVCVLVARVFGDGGESTATSNIDKAVEWCGK